MTLSSTDEHVPGLIQDLALNAAGLDEFLEALTQGALRHLGPANPGVLCGITLLFDSASTGTGGALPGRIVAGSSGQGRALEELQSRLAYSPSRDAARLLAPVHIPDLTADTRWVDCRNALEGYGVRSVLSVPFDLRGEARATLTFYAAEAESFGPGSVFAAQSFARQASAGSVFTVRLAARLATARQLQTAMEARTEINLAIGILMGQRRCSQPAALQLLESAAREANRSVEQAAGMLVESVARRRARTHFQP
jgi:hypothetical protein